MKRVSILAAAAAIGFGTGTASAQQVSLLSSRPDTVSDGNALIAVAVPNGSGASDIVVRVGSTDVTPRFKLEGGTAIGLVEGLKPGRNRITAAVRGRTGSLDVTNHGRNGPIFSGPHQKPFMCETADFKLPDGSTLGPPLDADCNVETRVDYLYRAKGERRLKPLPAGGALPADMDTATTLDGQTVNYIVRVETGTINRSVYQTAVLFDPSKGEKAGPTERHPGWNGRVVFSFGGGATAGYHQGSRVGDDMLGDDMLSRGFAVVSSSLNVMAIVGSDVLSAETASMVKERFIETFGPVRHTIGWGGSGGSMQQHLIANNYPGILDGIIPGSSFPDLYTLVPYAADCSLMGKVFSESKTGWTDEQKRAASGLNTWATCAQWNQFFVPEWMFTRQADPKIKLPGFKDSNCHAVVPRELTYDPKRNPGGARCDIFSAARNSIGYDKKTGATYRTFDNVGVQYGLTAYREGTISPEQFVELNEKIGGYDDDGNFQQPRTAASVTGIQRMFETGRVNEGQNLDLIPVIDLRGNPVRAPNVHDAVNSEIMRARLERANGETRGYVMVRGQADPTAPGSGTVSGSPGMDRFALLKMDEWLSNIAADTRTHKSAPAKVAANRPADLISDVCIMAGGKRIDEASNIANKGECGEKLPYFSEPRLVAGEPLTRDILKCHLRPFRAEDYPGMAPDLVTRLRAVFASGVCDYSKPSVGYKPLKGSWLAYPAPGVAVPLK